MPTLTNSLRFSADPPHDPVAPPRNPVAAGRKFALVVLVLAAATAGTFARAAQKAELRLVSTAWPPFTNSAGQPRFALDLVESAFERIGVSATTVIVEASAFTTSLLTGQFDGSAAAWRDAEREKVLLYSDAYLENRLILVGRRGSDVSATSLAALKGKKIAIVQGYSYGDGVDASGPTFVRSRREEASLDLLLTNAVDYTLMDEIVVEYLAANHAAEVQKRLQFGSTPLLVRSLHLAVRRTVPAAASIVDRFNTQLKAMITDRTYHRLLHLDWIRADVDGDGRMELVPSSDQAGPTAPTRAYTLSWTPEKTKSSIGNDRFYVGGQVYNAWTDVPDSYKVSASGAVDPNRSTLAVFRFTWK